METSVQAIDIALSIIICIGVIQLLWFSVMLMRRGIPPQTIQQCLPPILAIWVLMWPVYSAPHWVWIGIMALGVPILLASMLPANFWRDLKQAWSDANKPQSDLLPKDMPSMWPVTHLLTALAIAAAFFQFAPEFGFGIALSICLALPAANWIDRTGRAQLGFALHPEQTLAGHVILIVFTAVLCNWSLHVYHGIDWQQLFVATVLVGIAASLARALTPGGWHQPAVAASMGATLWLL